MSKMVTFFIGAHQDDWQLFMTPTAYRDLINSSAKVVFIYTTAGDAGKGTRWWQARRAGALGSVQFAKRKPIEYLAPQTFNANGHQVPWYEIDNSRSYFLNVPDGNVNGSGFSATGFESLEKLYDDNRRLNSLDDQSEYHTFYCSWDNLKATIKSIIDFESVVEVRDHSWINFLDPTRTLHSDHTYTGKLIEETLSGNPKYRFAKYIGYPIKDMAENVSGTELIWKTGMYLTYNQLAFEMPDGEDHLSSSYLAWLFRQYRS